MLSAILITYNEAHNITRCLESIRWIEDIVVVDAFSTDDTVKRSRRFTSRVYLREWQGYAAQRVFAFAKARGPWVLNLDADEEVSPELAEEIRRTLQEENPYSGFRIPRKTQFLGRWIEHSGWYPDYQLRLFRKDHASIVLRRVHEGFVVSGPVGQLRNFIYHHSYTSIAQYFEKMNHYTTLQSEDKRDDHPSLRPRWYNFLFNPLSQFVRMYLVHQGFRDGFPGFLLAVFSAMSTLTLYGKVWEQTLTRTSRLPIAELTRTT